ncbi:transcriptional regulator ATRX-like isoform X3 [Penaeus indicus]|uniref:transcriptional regulator ATRX-like isoform X3 n=1 Tax=Penaeus indicus TaxID=29960 RepID=UPI00300C0AF7
MESFMRMEHDPDGNSQQVAVIMTGQVYREAGLKHSEHPKVEGMLYDKLCQIGKHKLRDDVRKMALNIALMVSDKEFKPTVAWLDNFMRRFCLSRKKMGFHSSAMLKRKDNVQPQTQTPASGSGLTQEDVFSVLGINMDGNGLPEEDGKVAASEKILEDVIAETENGVNGNQGIETDSQTSLLDTVDKNCSIEDLFASDSENVESKTTSLDQNVTPNPKKEQVVCEEIEQLNKLENLTSQMVQSQDSDDDIIIEKSVLKTDTLPKESKMDIEKETIKREQDSSNDEENNDDYSSKGSDSDKDNTRDKKSAKGKGKNSGSSDGDSQQEDQADAGGKKSRQVEDEMTIRYTKEEDEYYRKNISDLQKKLRDAVMRCTACNEQINHQIRSLVYTHPVLGVLSCKRCRKYYGKGRFCKDEEGYDEYCRLCAEGGDLLCCEQEGCFNGFCKRCIKRTMGRSELKNAETAENWACYVCDKTSMTELRALHRAILSNLEESEVQDDNLSRKELNKKNLLSKFELLKKNRKERAIKNSPKKVEKKTEKDKSVDSRGKQGQTWLNESIETMVDMLSLCLKNVEKINSTWKSSQYSAEGTEKAGKRILKQLTGMITNFEILEKNVSAEVQKLVSEEKVEDSIVENKSKKSKKEVEESTTSSPKKKSSLKETNMETEEQVTPKRKRNKSKIDDEDVEADAEEGSRTRSKKTASQDSSKASSKEEMEVDDASQDSSKANFRSEDECSANIDDPMEQDEVMNNISDAAVEESGGKGVLETDDEAKMENPKTKSGSDGEGEEAEKDSSILTTTTLEYVGNENTEKSKRSAKASLSKKKDGEESADSSEEQKTPLSNARKTRRSKSTEELDEVNIKKELDSDIEKEVKSKRGRKAKDQKKEERDSSDEKGSFKKEESVEEEKKVIKKEKEEEDSEDSDEEADNKESKSKGRKQKVQKEEKQKKEKKKLISDEEEENGSEKVSKGKKPKRGRKPKEEESDEETKKKSKAKARGNRESEDGDSKEKKKTQRRRTKKRRQEDDEDDMLGIGDMSSNEESSEEEDTDTEMRRRREEYEDHSVKKKKKKMMKKDTKKEKGSGEGTDSNDEKKPRKSPMKSKGKKKQEEVNGKESSDEEEANDKETAESKKGGNSPKKSDEHEKKKKKKENNEAFSELLASESENDKDNSGDEKETGANDEPMECSQGESSEGGTPEKKKRQAGKSKGEIGGENGSTKKGEKQKNVKRSSTPNKDDNQMAMASLLESESDYELEDKPKPKCKKKNFLKKYAEKMEKVKHLTEEEKEELKEKQLESKCQTKVQKISTEVKSKLEKDEFIDVKEFPEFRRKKEAERQKQAKHYDGEADEEDSDEEFEKLMKFDVNKKFNKPGPKSKKKYQESEPEEEGEADVKVKSESDKEEKDDKSKVKKEGVTRKKKEGLLDISIDKEEEEDEEEEEEPEEGKKKKGKDGGISLNEKMKKQILMSSDEDAEEEEEEEEEEKEDAEEDEKRRKKYEEKKKKKKAEEKEEEEEEAKEEENKEEEEESSKKVYKKGYMNLNISSDDGEVGEQDDEHVPDSEEEEEEEEEEEDEEDDSDFEESPRKRRTFQISSSESDDDKKKKRKKKVTSSENESEELEEAPKPKRKRIRKMSSSSDEGDGDDGNKEDSPSKHRKIRRVIRDEDLMETTKNATQEEEERRKRITERQKQYNQIFEIDVESDQKDLGKLVLDFDPDTKKELVSVDEKLVKFLKPHQFKGIKFMWDATCESIEMLSSKRGSGCILAHCMGLGKTLQVITFTHTLLSSKKVNRHIQRVMVCCPVNTVYNWVNEYKNWLRGKLLHFEVSELVSAKDLWSRAYRLDDWWKEGGVCIMGYDMFRNLSNSKSKRYKGKMKEIFHKTLVDPGPDLIVCDEGHILKNEKTALSVAINKIRTHRRIILTGTPLQNNLKEYHCMIQFVKPNLLGTKKEFMNRFVNPIEQGQCADAMPRDVRRMKRRAHILHNMLEGCVQRFDYTVLKPFLPPKFEYVISIQLSDLQQKLYQYYLDNLAQGGPKRQGSGLFVDFGALSRVWTHPKVLELAVRRAIFQDDDDELADFICDDTTEEESSEDERAKKKKKKKKKKNEEDEESVEEEEVNKDEIEKPGPIPGLTESGKVRVDWWKKLVEEYNEESKDEDYLDSLEHGGKLILLLDILRECCSIGDKVLVFSQSLLALDMMEDFLELIDRGELEMPSTEDPLPLPFKQWKRDRDYLRLDGSTSPDARKNLCKTFNSSSNERCRLFLISTRAGGLGINLVAANRVVIFDSSWNPSHDTQSIFRVYRFGQKKPCYIYRFVAQGTMEEKIYSRQVTKMSTALRVVDEHQIKRYFKMEELAQLYEFTPADKNVRETPIVPEDRLLAELLKRQKDWIVNYHEHDSLLENQTSEELTEEERKAAWEDYENEKKGFMYYQQQRNSVMPVVGPATMVASSAAPSLSLSSFSFEGVVNTIKAQNPNLTQNELCESVVLATKQIQKIHLTHYQRVQGMVYNLKNPMIAPEQRKLLPFGNHPEMLPMLEQQLRMLEENIQRENQVINHMGQITSQRVSSTNMANMMSAGLIRGQPVSSGINSATANYVTRPTATPSTSMMMQQQQQIQQQQQLQQQTQNQPEKNPTSNDVIMLD